MAAFIKYWRSAMPIILAIALFLPPLYLLVVIQYAAITFPYWDHLTTVVQIQEYFDGTLTWKSLLEPQQPTRAFIPRLIFLGNAILTDWDIRSEYIYIYITIFGALATLLFALRRVAREWSNVALLSAALLISIIACSPVGAQNHYWSLMLIATVCYFSSIIAMVAVSVYPRSWPANILAAAFAWISAYSLGPGLFLMPILFLLQQIIGPNLLKLNRWSLFWLCNTVICYAVYFPGAPFTGSPTPGLISFPSFIAVYIGNPLGSLLWFPYMGAIDLPHTTYINAICGLLLITLTFFTAWRARFELLERRPEALIFFSFAAYTGACALVTGLGRAHGEFAIISANSSRYSLFSACLLFGLIIYYGAKFARGDLRFTILHKATFVLFIGAAAASYVRALPVYKVAHDDNIWLADVYNPKALPTDLDTRAYPDFEYFNPKRATLLRLGMGPYRSVPTTSEAIYQGGFVAPVPMMPGTVVRQRFKPLLPLIRSVTFQIVTWAKTPSSYRVQWKVTGLKSVSTLASGSFATSGLSDWQMITIPVNSQSEDPEIEISFSIEAAAQVPNPIGLALYKPNANPSEPAEINGHASKDDGRVGIRVRYAQ